jgi:hypothetical protein
LTYDAGYAAVYATSSNNLRLGANGSISHLFINTSGDVGINNVSPGYKLDVSGSFNATSVRSQAVFVNAASPTVYLQDTDGLSSMLHCNSDTFYILGSSVNNSTGWAQPNGYWPLQINLANNNAQFGGSVYIPYNLGVGNASASQKLEVSGGNGSNQIRISYDADTRRYNDIKNQWDGSVIASNQMVFKVATTSVNTTVDVLALDGNANVRVSSGSLGVNVAPNTSTGGRIDASNDIVAFSSDRRLKKNIETISDPLDKVEKLTGFTYNWNELANEKAGYSQETRHVGVYAQEVQDVLPEAVKLAPFDNDGTDTSISGENYLTVQYEKIVPLLIESIKELRREVSELKAQIKNQS